MIVLTRRQRLTLEAAGLTNARLVLAERPWLPGFREILLETDQMDTRHRITEVMLQDAAYVANAVDDLVTFLAGAAAGKFDE